MSDMYLTKVERKTIFTQGLIYVLFTFIISDLTVTGPHIFSIIPWLFFLGIMGVNKFYHPIMTVVLSTATTFIASLFKYDGLNMQALTSTIVALAMTTSGLIVGLCIKDFVLEHRLVKQLSVHKKILNISAMVLLTVGSIVLYAARYGNVIGYVQSRLKLDEYVTTNCKVEDYLVEEQQFLSGSFGRYVYIVKVEENTLKLKVGSNVELINFEELKEKAELKLNEEFKKAFPNNVFNVKLNYEYTTLGINPSNIIVTSSIEDFDVENTELLAKVVNDLKNICDYKDELKTNVTKVILSINGGVQVINKHDFDKISEEYIKNSVSVETFDMN